jgi:hypothetical protein
MRHTRKQHIRAAGVAFVSPTHILAAYQPHKTVPFISGIGGSREAGETLLECAIREMSEELFGLTTLNTTALGEPLACIHKHGYAMFLYTFDDLERLLRSMRRSRVRSPYYDGIPVSVGDLVLRRRVVRDAELSHLSILPLIPNHPAGAPFVVPYFVEDMAAIAAHLSV